MKKMKQMSVLVKCLLIAAMELLLLVSPLQTVAADNSRSYEYILNVNENDTVYAETGEILTVVLTLKRTDSEEASSMRAMQDEIRYHPDFFEIVEDSIFTADGVETTDIALTDGSRAFYINFLSLGEEAEWKSEMRVATFQIRVLGEKGSSYLINENCKVSLRDGSGSYETSTQDLLVIVTEDGIVGSIPEKFVTQPEEVSATVSEEAEEFPSWILIAAFYAAIIGFLIFLFKKPNLIFMLDETREYTKMAVRRGRYAKKPSDPVEEEKVFEGWYLDNAFTKLWDFEKNKVVKSVKLYAKWAEAKEEPKTEAEIPDEKEVKAEAEILPETEE